MTLTFSIPKKYLLEQASAIMETVMMERAKNEATRIANGHTFDQPNGRPNAQTYEEYEQSLVITLERLFQAYPELNSEKESK